MKDIIICGVDGVFELAEKVLSNVRLMAGEGISLKMRSWRRGGLNYIALRLLKEGQNYDSGDEFFRRLIATAISDAIVDEWERGMIDRIVERDYDFFLPNDRILIAERVADLLEVIGLNGDTAYENPRKKAIYDAALFCLAEHNVLNIEGFINFRLRDYLETLDESVTMAVDEFLLEKEHDEYTGFLRHIAGTQEPQIDFLKVYLSRNGFRLLDENGREIGEQCPEKEGSIAGSTGVDDFLISTLVTLSPRKIVLHYDTLDGREETIRLLRDVFADRLSLCPGCELCDGQGPPVYGRKK